MRRAIATINLCLLLILAPTALLLLPYSPLYVAAAAAATHEVPSVSIGERLAATEQIVRYLWSGIPYDLSLSEQARLHLEDVRVLFIAGLIALLCSTALFIFLPASIRTAGKYTAIVMTVASLLAAMSFRHAFTLFHTILFANDLWLFPVHDSLILLFPQTFFIVCAAVIALCVITLCALLAVFFSEGDAPQRVASGDLPQHI